MLVIDKKKTIRQHHRFQETATHLLVRPLWPLQQGEEEGEGELGGGAGPGGFGGDLAFLGLLAMGATGGGGGATWGWGLPVDMRATVCIQVRVSHEYMNT